MGPNDVYELFINLLFPSYVGVFDREGFNQNDV